MEEDIVVKTIKEEYEKKIAEMEAKHKEELEKVKKEAEDKAVAQIKAIISGRQEEIPPVPPIEEEKGFFETSIEETINLLKGGK